MAQEDLEGRVATLEREIREMKEEMGSIGSLLVKMGRKLLQVSNAIRGLKKRNTSGKDPILKAFT